LCVTLRRRKDEKTSLWTSPKRACRRRVCQYKFSLRRAGARKIKALSEQEVEDYLSGKGLGYAKAAELNHYPGPRHVLDFAKELNLTDEQTRRTQAIFNAMRARAIPLGKQLVEKERELDREFAARSIRGVSLNALLSDIGALQARIRYVHLSAHFEQKALLTKHQIQMYDKLRGD
jgi:Spy/CpxP family protein refolding chaperone